MSYLHKSTLHALERDVDRLPPCEKIQKTREREEKKEEREPEEKR